MLIIIIMSNQHIVPHPDWGWGVRWAWNDRFTVRTDTQAEAIDVGTWIAQNQSSEVLIHGRNGQIRERNSYWNDPRNIPW